MQVVLQDMLGVLALRHLHLPLLQAFVVYDFQLGKIYDYQIRIAYSTKVITEKSKQVISEILSQENDELRKKFERITGLDKLGFSISEK